MTNPGHCPTRTAVFLVFAFVMVSRMAHAQETPRFEIAGVYILQAMLFESNCHGGGGTVAYNPNSWFGVVGEISGCRARVSTGAIDTRFSYLAGPRVSYRRTFTPYAQILFGGTHQSEFGSFRDSGNHFALTAGFGLEVKLTDRFALRLIQPEYVRTAFSDQVRIQTGVVFALGR